MLNHLLAAVLFSAGELQPARLHIEASLARRPDSAPARLLAGRIARGLGDFDAALTHLDRALALSPQRDALFEKARTLDAAGLKPQARDAWGAILKALPQSREAAARLGRLAWEDGEYADRRCRCLNARRSAKRPRPSGSTSVSFARICAITPRPPKLTARRSPSSPTTRRPRSISARRCRKAAISTAPCAPMPKPIGCGRTCSAPSRWR